MMKMKERRSALHFGKEEFIMDPRMVRMVLRVPPDLQEDLIQISERLFDETRLEYSYAAILRGLISLGLSALAAKATLAGEFNGTRVMRGRRRGELWKNSVKLEKKV